VVLVQLGVAVRETTSRTATLSAVLDFFKVQYQECVI
jgi:hypothetical protein